MSGEATQKSGVPQIIKSNVALKLAEQWVNNMTKVAEDEQTEAESDGRPSRLGLGAKFSCQMRPGPLNDPVERKLFANLQSGKRKAAKDAEESGPTARDPGGDSDIDDELESRASAFAKKRAIAPPVPVTMKKKRR
ncbi:uncharacterized protein LOC115662545 [Syzygium oleosum]|uniref:uncharacterized protein LOC115662545 n=1 Tax=Syzygium oleosum TaxID=219896 RepID=UPI0011D19644|nr:uncharacterized protein LOC115662545 [Syzygium oleosum]